jgi:predicted MFS family arabinose efflux permease
MKFTRYQIIVVTILTIIQFTVLVDFMIVTPLGVLLLEALNVTTHQFGLLVSAYAFSAGASGLLVAGFADKFDRKKLLLFFYTGFVFSTFFCGIAPSYPFLLAARIVTGLFGGVVGAITFAIIADLFPLEARGRVIGIMMSDFAASQVLGIPLGLYLSNAMGWRAPFFMIAAVSAVVGVVIFTQLRPVDDHLKMPSNRNAFRHLLTTMKRPRYQWGFACTAFLALPGFLLMPFSSAFSVYNMGIKLDNLPMVYMVTGLGTIVTGPVMGRASDRVGKFRIFVAASTLAIVVVSYYTHVGNTPLWLVIGLDIVLLTALTVPLIAFEALASAIPESQDRGAYMSLSFSLQQIGAGVASAVAGLVVSQGPEGLLQNYDRLGYIVSGVIVVTIFFVSKINRIVNTAPPVYVPAARARVSESRVPG